MRVIADLQIHSKYARAVSKYMDLFEIQKWAQRKGINLVATGDWQHPEYFKHILENLVEINDGIYRLKNEKNNDKVNFILGTEISSIYKQGGKSRRVHNLVLSPSLATCEKVITELTRRGCNLKADGRPIIGISSKDLLQLLLDIDKNIIMIPAHVWTPWFGMYGSKSGFDSIIESFGELEKYVYAIETGLSSDPAMNWQIKELEDRAIVSFSDAHSGPKLGREATVFQTKNNSFTYFDLIEAIKQNPASELELSYTIEFFPEEGKYHWSGHRACNVIYSPEEIVVKGDKCPVCGKALTVGVTNRVLHLADNIIKETDLIYEKDQFGVTCVFDKEKKRKPFVSCIPLLEILQEVLKSKAKAEREYFRLTDIAPEFEILLEKSLEEIESYGIPKLAEAIKQVRERNVHIEPGYDGVFGKISVF